MKLAVQVDPADDPELAAWAARELVRALAGTDPIEAQTCFSRGPEAVHRA